MRLPARVCLPFGYVVLVRQVSDQEMRAQDDDGDLNDGLWDCETRTIYVRSALPMKRRRYILAHELGHCLWDYQHAMFDEGAFKP